MKALKKKIEKGKFKIICIKFNPRTSKFLRKTRIYVLKTKNKMIYLGLKYDITDKFRTLLKEVYGERWFKDYPDNFFKDYVHKEYLKGLKITEKTQNKKKENKSLYWIKRKETRIKRLEEELIKEKENLRIARGFKGFYYST